jgi:hypothetical protein
VAQRWRQEIGEEESYGNVRLEKEIKTNQDNMRLEKEIKTNQDLFESMKNNQVRKVT